MTKASDVQTKEEKLMRFQVFMMREVYRLKNGRKTEPDFAPEAEMMAKVRPFKELKEACCHG